MCLQITCNSWVIHSALLYKACNAYSIKKKTKKTEEAKGKVGSNTFYDKVLSEIKGRIEFHLCTSR